MESTRGEVAPPTRLKLGREGASLALEEGAKEGEVFVDALLVELSRADVVLYGETEAGYDEKIGLI